MYYSKAMCNLTFRLPILDDAEIANRWDLGPNFKSNIRGVLTLVRSSHEVFALQESQIITDRSRVPIAK